MSAPDHALPLVNDRYHLQKLIQASHLSEVWQVREDQQSQPVSVIKICSLSSDEGGQAARREAAMLQSFKAANMSGVPTVREVFEFTWRGENSLGLVMERLHENLNQEEEGKGSTPNSSS